MSSTSDTQTQRQWRGQTFGNSFMHRSLTWMIHHWGLRTFYVFTALVVVPPIMFSGSARIIYRYLRECHGRRRLSALRGTYRNLCLFSQVVIDRFAMYGGRQFDVKTEGYEHFQHLASLPEGFVQLSAHVGNYELAGYTLKAERKRFNALVFADEKQTVMHERQHLFGSTNIRMIPVSGDMSHLFAINSALADGETVSMPADRAVGSAKTIGVTFLGRATQLPAGPFTVATMRGCNVLAVNVMKTATEQYTVIVTPLSYDRSLPRRKQCEQLAQAFASELERVLRKYPEQWYNYYNFWQE